MLGSDHSHSRAEPPVHLGKRPSDSPGAEHGDHIATKKSRHEQPCPVKFVNTEFTGPRKEKSISFEHAPQVETIRFRIPAPGQREVDAELTMGKHTEQSYAGEVTRQDLAKTYCAAHNTFDTQQSCFTHIGTLGHGSYGIVDKVEYSGVALFNGKHYARKVVRYRNPKQRSNIMKELEITKLLWHEHIVRVIMTYEELNKLDRNFGIIMEPVADSNLQDYMEWMIEKEEYTRGHTRETIQGWFGCLASALAYLHAKRIRHKDIKPSNILVSNDRILYADFGLSVYHDDDEESKSVGDPGARTVRYSAPEIEAHQPRGRKADVFSLGCVYLEMLTVLTGRSIKDFRRFVEVDANQAYHQNPQKILCWTAEIQPNLPSMFLQRVLVCALSMLEHNPQARLSSFQVALRLAGYKSMAMPGTAEKKECPCNEIFGTLGDCQVGLRLWQGLEQPFPPGSGAYTLHEDILKKMIESEETTCPFCGEASAEFLALIMHLTAQHADAHLQLILCPKEGCFAESFASWALLEKHMKDNHPEILSQEDSYVL